MSRRGLLRFIALPSMVPALLTAAMLGQATPGYAGTFIQQSVDLPYGPVTLTNICTTPADIFIASGTFHLVVGMDVDELPTFHIISMVNTSNVKGVPVAPSTTNYVVSQTDTLTSNLNSSSTTTDSSTDHLYFISQGSSPNFMERLTFHFTMNAQGVVTVNDIDATSDPC